MSAREDAVNEILEACGDFDLCQVYAGDTGLSEDKKYRYVTICRARNLDGEIRVYTPKYILLKFETRYQNCPHKETVKFNSVEETIDFLRSVFVEYKNANEILSGIKK